MPATHKRNTGPMRDAPRCGARTRSGAPCQAPKVAGAKRCRMHGGKGSGAPRSNRNALKHGAHTAEMKARARQVRLLVLQARMLIAEMTASTRSSD